MLKIIFLFAFVTVSNAEIRKGIFTSGHIIQGIDATGVTIKKNSNGQQEIEWTEQFDNNNSLTVYGSHIYEKTGLLETVEIDNLCANYPRDTFEDNLKKFVLRVFRGANKCPIKKGKRTIRYPINNTYETSLKSKICGPVISTIHIVRNKKPGSDKAPLLLTAQFRGVIDGDDYTFYKQLCMFSAVDLNLDPNILLVTPQESQYNGKSKERNLVDTRNGLAIRELQ